MTILLDIVFILIVDIYWNLKYRPEYVEYELII